MNVALGGTLYTHIPDQLPNALDHSYPGNMRTVLVHEVKIEEGMRIAEVMGEPILQVNSLHHQGLKDIAPSLRVAGISPDGLVEAVELPDHPFALAVQWHPEWLTDQEPTRNLFRKFVEAAQA
jgi:putative glutamine amidotransferase